MAVNKRRQYSSGKASAKPSGRTPPPPTRLAYGDEETVVSVRMNWGLIRALDGEAEVMNIEQAPGRSGISRGELIRILLHEGLAAHKKARADRG